MELLNNQFNLPTPYPWQAQYLEIDKRVEAKLSVLCCGRRAGKTFVAMLWALTAKGGVLAAGHVCWIAPDDKRLAEARSWAKAWLAPLLVPGNPGSIGIDLSNGGRLDFWSAGPQAPQPARGRGYDLCVIDEAAFISGLRLMVDASIRPALALSGGRMLMISTPRGMNSFREYYQEAERSGVAFHAPSTMNPELKASELEQIRRTTAPIIFEQEYLGRFVEQAGCLMKHEYVRKGAAPSIESFLTLSFGLDIALATHDRSDYSALVVAGISRQRQLWILMARRWRKTWPESVALLADYNRIWKPQIAVCEQVAFQELCVRDLLKVGLPLIGLKVSKGKEERFLPVLSRFAIGEILIADTIDSEFLAELMSFPESAFDDQVDSLVYSVGGLVSEIRDAWSPELSSGAQWGGRLPHEKRKGTWCFDFWGQPHLLGGEDDYDEGTESAPQSEPAGTVASEPAKEPPAPWLPEFYEKLVGDEFVVIARDSGKELMRAHRCKMPFYQGLKAKGELDWQVKGLDGYLKTL